jgi:putative tryptophan/tyrosine transport system substrate-binding protein
MKRREFITLVGGTALLPLSLRAQQPDRIYRIGVLTLGTNGELSAQQRAVFTKTLMELGWTEGKNIQIDQRWAANDVARIPALARELLSLKPDVILVQGTPTVATLQRETKTTPIIFVSVTDPVLSGAVASLSHPGGNVTGFSNFEPTLAGKYVEILKEITPGMTAVVVMSNPDNFANFITRSLEAAARYHGVELVSAPARDASEIEGVISGLGDKPTTGLFVSGDPLFGSGANLALTVSLAIRYRVRAVYSFRHFVEAGGLISYGNDLVEQYRQAAAYVDRILRGANPADLPVQAPTKFEMVINLKTARTMGLTIPPTLLARADEVIE